MRQVFDYEPISVGIDVGWSTTRRTCALAIQGIRPSFASRDTREYPGRNGRAPAFVRLFTFADLLDELETLVTDMPQGLRGVTLVVDGPLGPSGPPTNNRWIDFECGRNGFYRRTQPSHVEPASGQTYVNATDRIVEKFGARAGRTSPWLGGESSLGEFRFAETHPTIGLATMIPQQNVAGLPTRARPRLFRIEGGSLPIRAKSDWYWRIGAGLRIENVVGCVGVHEETNHERIAGLFCLAVAMQLSSMSADNSTAVVIGRDDGVYVIPAAIDRTWVNDVNPLVFGDRATLQPVQANTLPSNAPTDENYSGDDLPCGEDDSNRGDDETLLLRLDDNGGVATARNPWLDGANNPVRLTPTDGYMPFQPACIELTPFINNDHQWRSKPTTYALANARGFDGPYLSANNGITILVRLL